MDGECERALAHARPGACSAARTAMAVSVIHSKDGGEGRGGRGGEGRGSLRVTTRPAQLGRLTD